LADADASFPGEDELLLEDAQANPEGVLPRLVNGRLRFVVFKRGGKGGILYDAQQARFHTWVAHTESVVDQTGAGDAFATGFVCAYLDGLSVDACVQRAWPSKGGERTPCSLSGARMRKLVYSNGTAGKRHERSETNVEAGVRVRR